MSTQPDPRQWAPAAGRNRAPILDVLTTALPASGLVLEIASGSGEHVVHFARSLPKLTFQPSDPMPDARASIAAWVAAEGLANVRPPLALDAASHDWPVGPVDAIVCINMIHISPWSATLGLMAGAGARLPAGGPLVVYGPFLRAGIETAPGNLAFDASLRARDPAWGLRHLEDVVAQAAGYALALERVVEMPANNITAIFRKAG